MKVPYGVSKHEEYADLAEQSESTCTLYPTVSSQPVQRETDRQGELTHTASYLRDRRDTDQPIRSDRCEERIEC